MKKTIVMSVILFWSLMGHAEDNTSIFGGGPFYHDAENVVPLVNASGFRTVILWTLHFNSNGDLIFNDNTIVKDGKYVGNVDWPRQLSRLKESDSSVKRVEFSVGSWGVPDFETIGSLIDAQGSDESNILYRNFAELKRVLPILDAINFDDESFYDLRSAFLFSVMLTQLGYHVTISPYTRIDFWSRLYFALNTFAPGVLDAVYLQGYAGGTGANPALWNTFFPGLKVQLGLWSKNGPGCVQGQSPWEMGRYFSQVADHLSGGWVWLLDDVLNCKTYSLSQYAKAIESALKK